MHSSILARFTTRTTNHKPWDKNLDHSQNRHPHIPHPVFDAEVFAAYWALRTRPVPGERSPHTTGSPAARMRMSMPERRPREAAPRPCNRVPDEYRWETSLWHMTTAATEARSRATTEWISSHARAERCGDPQRRRGRIARARRTGRAHSPGNLSFLCSFSCFSPLFNLSLAGLGRRRMGSPVMTGHVGPGQDEVICKSNTAAAMRLWPACSKIIIKDNKHTSLNPIIA